MLTRILVATDGQPAADAAVRCAARMAAQREGTVELVTVVEPLPMFDAAYSTLLFKGEELHRQRADEIAAAVRAQVARITGSEATWRVTVAAGHVAQQIARAADECEADMIILGAPRIDSTGRVSQSNTVTELLRLTAAAVLAVPAHRAESLRHAVVACDFSPASRRAARTALSVVVPPARVDLVHVVPDVHVARAGWENWEQIYREGIDTEFAHLRRALSVAPGVDLRIYTLRGDPAQEIAAFAAREAADLVAMGSHGHSFLERILIGSIAVALLHEVREATLVTPPPATAGVESTEDLVAEHAAL
jgi:nucleotide-binding universal stress UspA family protein